MIGKLIALTTPTILVWAGWAVWPAQIPAASMPVYTELKIPDRILVHEPLPNNLPFRERWLPVSPPMVQPVIVPDLPTTTYEVPYVRATPSARKAYANVCARHGMRKVTNGRSWRCRR